MSEAPGQFITALEQRGMTVIYWAADAENQIQEVRALSEDKLQLKRFRQCDGLYTEETFSRPALDEEFSLR